MVVDGIKTPLQMAKEMYALQNGGKSKRGRKPVFSANQFYPWRVEREMEQFIAEWLKENGERLKSAAIVDYDADGIDEVNDLPPFVPSNAEEKAREFYDKANSFSSSAMDNFSEKTIGRSIGYYVNDSELKNNFVSNFIEQCKSASQDQKKDIANAVYRHRMFPNSEGKNLSSEINDINKKYTKSKAKFIARNETGNLNAAIQRRQIEGAGYSMYVWVAMPDGVTRDAHRAMNGKVCRWDDPTVYSEDGGKTWKKRTAGMFIGEPGQDYNCRCTAIPFESGDEEYLVTKFPEEEEPKEPEIKETKAELVAKLEAETKRADKAEKELEKSRTNLRKLSESLNTAYSLSAENKVSDAFKKDIQNSMREAEDLVFPKTDKEKLEYAAKSGLYTAEELVLFKDFLSKKENFKINKDKQSHHNKLSKNYNKSNSSNSGNFVGSSYFIEEFNPYEKFDRLIGCGYIEFGKQIKQYVKMPYNVGYAGNNDFKETNVISIRFSKSGMHMFPVHPNKYDDEVRKKKDNLKNK